MSLLNKLEEICRQCDDISSGKASDSEFRDNDDLDFPITNSKEEFNLALKEFREYISVAKTRMEAKQGEEPNTKNVKSAYVNCLASLKRVSKCLNAYYAEASTWYKENGEFNYMPAEYRLSQICKNVNDTVGGFNYRLDNDLREYEENYNGKKEKIAYNKDDFNSLKEKLAFITEKYPDEVDEDDKDFQERYGENNKKIVDSAKEMLKILGDKSIDDLSETQSNSLLMHFNTFKEESAEALNDIENSDLFHGIDTDNYNNYYSYDDDLKIDPRVFVGVKNAVEDVKKIEKSSKGVDINKDFSEFLKKIDSVDPMYIKSSDNFRKAKAAIGDVVKMTKNGINNQNKEIVNKKILEALDYCELYTDVKDKEKNRSGLANARLQTMIEISKKMDKIAKNTIGDLYKTNQQVADELKNADTSRLSPKESEKLKASKKYLANSDIGERFNQKICDAYIKQKPVAEKQATAQKKQNTFQIMQ